MTLQESTNADQYNEIKKLENSAIADQQRVRDFKQEKDDLVMAIQRHNY